MPHSYDYAIVRVTPRVEREEFLNAGAIVFCRTLRYLQARVELDSERLRALAPGVDIDDVQDHLLTIPRICAGVRLAGPIGELSFAERFHWLVASRSTLIQTSAVHSGVCTDPEQALELLVARMVRVRVANERIG